MLDIRYIILIILLGITIYLVYNLYSYQTNKLDKLKENISEQIEIEFEEINDKLGEIEELIEKRIGDCNKKINDLYSLQNKMNEINKMNNQSIINQINQYDEAIEELGENKDQIFNSVENSVTNKQNTNCFIKINQTKTNEKEKFYMSPNEKYLHNENTSQSELCENENTKNNLLENTSKTSKLSENSELSRTSKSTKNEKKQNENVKKESDNSFILEINDVFIKTPYMMDNTPKASTAYKSLNEFSNIIKNNSVSKFNSDEINKHSKYSNSDSGIEKYIDGTELVDSDRSSSDKSELNSSNEIFIGNDPPLLHPDIINKMNILNKSIKSNKIIDITS